MDYPDDNEQFEMMYERELEDVGDLSQLMEEDRFFNRASKSKKCLDFSNELEPSPVTRNEAELSEKSSQQTPSKVIAESNDEDQAANIDSQLDRVTAQYDASKRKFAELFGDIADINFDDEDDDPYLPSKKPKPDTDKELIQRIKEQRTLNDDMLKLSRVNGNSHVTIEANKNNITQHVPRWPFIPVTAGDGQRLYIRIRSDDYIEKEVRGISVNMKSKSVSLLSVPYDKVRQQAQSIILQKLDNKEAERNTDSDVDIVEDSEHTGAQLWVEKYKPRSYIDLLSDETTNRTILHWLKLWDKVVFNREKKVRQKPKSSKAESKPFGQKFNRFTKKYGPECLDVLDSNNCPQQKLAMLCGPPGLGKTTLAHMLGKQAGYNVVEVNASDERSPEAFLNALQSATQMQDVLGTKKPNCLVLDEIDGAPAPSIELLVKFAMGKEVTKKKKNKKGFGGFLKRPIICICNDAYAPALRPLRLLALVVTFPPTVCTRLALRLMDISRIQHISTDLGVLLALAEKSNNDIRSCISILHFFKTKDKNKAKLTLHDVRQSNVGQKDVHKGLFQVWQEIFQIPRLNRGSSMNNKLQVMPNMDSPDVKFDEVSLATRMHKVLRTVQCCGDYDRLTQGVFENYPRMNIKDSYLDGVVDSFDWFCFTDVMNCSIYEHQHFMLMPYLPYAFVSYHFNFSSLAWPKLQFPNTSYETRMKLKHSQQVIKDLLNGLSPSVRSYTHGNQLLLDTLPTLVDILVPNLRPVSTQLYSKREKEDLQQVINVMMDFNLNYVQERTPEGIYEYRLDPNVEDLVQFPNIKSKRSLSYAGKQLLSQEIELEKMRREAALIKLAVARPEVPKVVPGTSASDKSAPAPAVVPSHLQSLVPKPIPSNTTGNPDRAMSDFFGRPILNQHRAGGEAAADEIVKSDVWLHFKEGFSNAVRKNVTVADMI